MGINKAVWGDSEFQGDVTIAVLLFVMLIGAGVTGYALASAPGWAIVAVCALLVAGLTVGILIARRAAITRIVLGRLMRQQQEQLWQQASQVSQASMPVAYRASPSSKPPSPYGNP